MTTMKRFMASALFGAALFASVSYAADDLVIGPVLAKGKGLEIRRSQLDDAFIAFRANLAARGQSIPEPRREGAEAQLLDRIIVTQLLVNKATDADRIAAKTNAVKFMDESRKAVESEEAFARHLKSLGMSLAQFTNRVMEQAISEEVITREVKSKINVTEAEIKKFYETNNEAFLQPELARASHILFATKDLKTGMLLTAEQKLAKKGQAEKILARAKKGDDFTKLAEEFSEDPGVKENKGEYKLARAKDDPRRAMVPEFEAAAFTLKPGSVSDIVTTEFGYHIIKLHEITPAKKVDLSEVRKSIEDYLRQRAVEREMPAFFAAVKKEAGVEILDERLRAALEKQNEGEGAKPSP